MKTLFLLLIILFTSSTFAQISDKNEPLKERLEVEPSFPGGQAALQKYMVANFKYPTLAIKNKEEGRVVVDFIVEKDGSLTDIYVSNPIAPLLDAEALRLVSAMPTWSPGQSEGKVVRVRFHQAIVFKLE